MKRTLRKMSHEGDTKIAEYEVGVTSERELKGIEEEFTRLQRAGWFAADITDQKDILIREFDPTADILMIPRMQGGV